MQAVLLTFKERIPLRQIERFPESLLIVRLRWRSAPADVLTYGAPHHLIEHIAANDSTEDKGPQKDVWPDGPLCSTWFPERATRFFRPERQASSGSRGLARRIGGAD